MTTGVPSGARSSSMRLLALSILIVLAGLLVVTAPAVPGLQLRLVVAWVLLATSALHLAFAWPFRPAAPVLWPVLLSAGYAAIGLYLLGSGGMSVDAVRYPVAAYLVFDGVIECSFLYRAARSAARPWLFLDAIVLDAIVTIVIAAMVATAWPSRTSWTMAALIGVNILLGGVSRLFVALSVRSAS